MRHGGRCVICGYSRSLNSLHFHHFENNKSGNVANLISLSWKRAQEEAAKCKLICANCHGETHDES